MQFDTHVINTNRDMFEVTSTDIHQHNADCKVVPVSYVDPKTNSPMPITIMKLGKFQELNFKLLARKGTGRMHAKWSPVATCIMYKEPIVKFDEDEKVNKELNLEQRKEFVECCPRNVFKFNELKQVIEIENSHDCNLCIECYRFTEKHNKNGNLDKSVLLSENDTKFNFTIESTGALPPVDIVSRAFKILKDKIDAFS